MRKSKRTRTRNQLVKERFSNITELEERIFWMDYEKYREEYNGI